MAKRGLTLPGAPNPYDKYQTRPYDYATTELGVFPWSGRGAKGQKELYDDIGDSVRRQKEGDQSAPRIFRVQAGNGLGKTYGIAPLVNWFFDSFAPSIVYTTGPGGAQVKDTLWKNIKAQRASHLPGRVLPVEARMEKGPNHFATAKTTSDAGGKGEERFKGQHDRFLMFLIDEADGVAKFVFDAILRMMTGGEVIIVILIGNPRSRNSEFFKWSRRAGVVNYRWSALDHPNVVDGRETVSGATTRQWVIERIWEWCEVVEAEDPDVYTFTLPWDVPAPPTGEGAWGPAGTILKPNAQFLTAIMGITPENSADNTLIPTGRYEAACRRVLPTPQKSVTEAQIGVDVASYGNDYGTIYIRLGMRVWRAHQVWKQDYDDYARLIRDEAIKLKALGVTHISLRIDAGGGFGQGVISHLKLDEALRTAFPGDRFKTHKIDFGGTPRDETAYADMATQMYAEAAESLKALRVERAPEALEEDLCDREYDWVNRAGVGVKKLEKKEEFKRRHEGRSPDDGDGFVLCVAPEFLVQKAPEKPSYLPRYGAARAK